MSFLHFRNNSKIGSEKDYKENNQCMTSQHMEVHHLPFCKWDVSRILSTIWLNDERVISFANQRNSNLLMLTLIEGAKFHFLTRGEYDDDVNNICCYVHLGQYLRQKFTDSNTSGMGINHRSKNRPTLTFNQMLCQSSNTDAKIPSWTKYGLVFYFPSK